MIPTADGLQPGWKPLCAPYRPERSRRFWAGLAASAFVMALVGYGISAVLSGKSFAWPHLVIAAVLGVLTSSLFTLFARWMARLFLDPDNCEVVCRYRWRNAEQSCAMLGYLRVGLRKLSTDAENIRADVQRLQSPLFVSDLTKAEDEEDLVARMRSNVAALRTEATDYIRELQASLRLLDPDQATRYSEQVEVVDRELGSFGEYVLEPDKDRSGALRQAALDRMANAANRMGQFANEDRDRLRLGRADV